MVRKPFVGTEIPQDPGTAKNCSPAFNTYFTYSNWASTIVSALEDFSKRSGRRRDIVIMGFSEGAAIAPRVARTLANVTRVALVGVTGTTQFYDMLVGEYLEQADDQTRAVALEKVGGEVAEILKDPDNSLRMYRGHPYRRWSSFFKVDVGEELLASHAKVYLLSGMQDRSVPTLSSEVLYARLLTQGHDVTIRRVPNATHSLMPIGSTNWDLVKPYLDTVRDWFLRP